MKWLLLILFIVISSTMFIFGCSGMQSCNINITEIDTYPQPLFEPLRLKVGAYYGDKFRTFDTIQQFKNPGMDLTEICNIQMGKANIALFDYILSVVFEKVTPVQHLPKGSDHLKDIELIIEPTVHSYTYERTTSSFGYIHIIYELNVYLPDGEQIDYWRIKGSGHVPVIISFKPSHIVKTTQIAMREVAAKFMTDFCKQGEIKKFFNKQCNP